MNDDLTVAALALQCNFPRGGVASHFCSSYGPMAIITFTRTIIAMMTWGSYARWHTIPPPPMHQCANWMHIVACVSHRFSLPLHMALGGRGGLSAYFLATFLSRISDFFVVVITTYSHQVCACNIYVALKDLCAHGVIEAGALFILSQNLFPSLNARIGIKQRAYSGK